MSHHLHHYVKLHRLHSTEMGEMYVSMAMHAFSTGLIGIFVPIYLYNLGFSAAYIAGFYIVHQLTKILIYSSTIKLMKRFGSKHALISSYFITFLYMVSLMFLADLSWLLIPTAMLSGLAKGTFWISRHVELASVIDRKRPSRQFSFLQIISLLAASLAPLAGGIIASRFGIHFAITAAAVGLMIAVVPLLQTKDPGPITGGKDKARLFSTAPFKHMIANAALNYQNMVTIFLWPLFIFLVLGSYDSVGLIVSVALVLSILATRLAGQFGDKGKSKQVMNLGAVSHSLIHIARSFAGSFTSAMGITAINDITSTFVTLPFTVQYYKNAQKYGLVNYLRDAEIAGDIAKIILWVSLFTISLALSIKSTLVVLFIASALMTPLIKLIRPKV